MARKPILSPKARLYAAIASWFGFAFLLSSWRYVSQVGEVIAMDTDVGSRFGAPGQSPSTSERHAQLTDEPRSSSQPLYWYVLLPLSSGDLAQPLVPQARALPVLIQAYELRTAAGKNLRGYALAVIWDANPAAAFWIPTPFFSLSRTFVRSSSREVSLVLLRRHGDIYGANVGLLSPRLQEVQGWSPPLPDNLYLVTVSVRPRGAKIYRWAVFSPPPIYQSICFGKSSVKAYAFYGTKSEGEKAALRLWDSIGTTETVKPNDSSSLTE